MFVSTEGEEEKSALHLFELTPKPCDYKKIIK